MPKIPVLGQQQVLNAGSPVPIASSSIARQEGENIAQFGNSLEKAGQNIAEFNKISKASNDSATLENARANMETVAQTADFTARGAVGEDGQPLQGQALIDNFSKTVDDSVKPLIDAQTDPDLKARLQSMAQETKNYKTAALYKDAIQRSVENIHETNKKTVATNIGNFYSAANGLSAAETSQQALKAIEGLGTSLNSQATYNPAERSRFTQKSNQEIAYAAVDSRANVHDYAGAKQVAQELAPYLDPSKITAIQKNIEDQKDSFASQQRTIQSHVEIERDRGERNEQKSNGFKLYAAVMSEKDPAKVQELLSKANVLVGLGKLDRSAADSIKAHYDKQNNPFAFNINQMNMNNHMAGQALGSPNTQKFLADLSDEVVAGHMNPILAGKFNSVMTQRQADIQKNPYVAEKFSQSDAIVANVLKGNLSEANAPNLGGGSRADVQANIMLKKDELIRQGKDPSEAATTALQAYVPKPNQQPIIPGFSPSLQGDSKGLNKIHEQLNEKLKAWKTLTPPQKDLYLQQRKAYGSRLGSVQIHEGVK